MPTDGMDDDDLHDILAGTRRIALVGASAKPDRPSHEVIGFLLRRGYAVTPVNPLLRGQRIHGQTVVADLTDAAPLDLVDLFRAAEHVGPLVAASVRLGARTIWMQLGVVDQAAASAARAAGLRVVMDRCPKIEWSRLRLGDVRAGLASTP